MRETSPSERKILANPPEDAYGESLRGPRPVKEIWRLLEYLMLHGTETRSLWTGAVDQNRSLEILTNLDTGKPLEDISSSAPEAQKITADHTANLAREVAACLTLLLSNLPLPLIPGTALAQCEAARDRDDAFAALEGVEQVNTNVSWSVSQRPRMLKVFRS